MWDRLSPWAGILLLVWLVAEGNAASQPAPCDKSRKVFTESWGIVTDGPIGANYTQDSHCEWLIKANNSRQFITLSFRSMGTECSYDYVFVYDGSSFTSPLLGSFSGKTEPQQVTATSGSMLILLYSDTNYVLDGFRAEFSVTECPRNCSGHGLCVNHACACDGDWGGRDCAIKLCPEDCGVTQARGVCSNGQCICNKGYSGQACSLSRADTVGRRYVPEVAPYDTLFLEIGFLEQPNGRCEVRKFHVAIEKGWHHLSHSENGFSPRAAHSVVYINETDSLYVFGGFDLNHVMGDLVIYRFATSHWEAEDGKQLDGTAVWSAPLDPPALAAVLEKGGQRWGLPPKSSLFHAVLRSVKDNATLSIHRQRLDPRGEHLARIPREANGDVDDIEGLTTLQPEAPAAQQTEIGGEDVTTEQTQVPSSTSPSPPTSTTPHVPSRPAPRYGHAACRSAAGMVLYGGKLSDGSLSGELWLYDLKQRRWSLRAVNSKIRPPRLTRHTLTLADGYLYLFGGSTPGGDFSSQLFRIRIIPGEKGAEEEEWEEVRPRGGKELDVRVVAHSTVYHAYSNCLIVYGGVVAGVKRYSKLSDRMFVFQLDSRHWAELSYPRAHLPDTYVPRERAFHTSSIIGNYLVVFGGYSHRHNKEEICYDSQLYLYHLGCHTWVNHEVLGTAEKVSRYPKQQGVFAHAAAVRNGNTLLIVGGYHGNVNADLLAFVLPPTLASREGEPYEPEQSCVKHLARTECTANPECGWCSVDDTCYGRTVGVNCTTNLQVTRCLGICPALGDCHSCLVHGVTWNPQNVPGGPPMGESSGMLGSAAHKLRLGQCTWCVQNARCHHKDDNYGVCGLREDLPSPIPGWWGPKGTEVTRVHECSVLDRRPGLTFVQYKHPANWSQPDLVNIMNATTVDFNLGSSQWPYVERGGGVHIARLMGSLFPPESWDHSHETLRICASYSTAVLRVAHFPDANDTSTPIHNAQLEEVGNFTAEQSRCMSAVYAPGKPVLLDRGRYLVDFESRKIQSAEGTHFQSKMELQHNRSQENAKVFTFEYLAPYENGSCWQYSNCLACLTDSACGWCEVSNSCLDRKLNETESCRSRESNDWHYLTLQPAACPNCSNYISCDSCLASQLCEWWTKDARCTRRGRSEGAVVDPVQCPAPCHTRKNCSRCLEERGVCVWCEATQECFSFSVYTSEYQFGLCREWLDQAYHGVAGAVVSGAMNGPSSLLGGSSESIVSPNLPSQQCKWCGRHENCSSCLHTLGCGWCYSADNPIVGVCVEGDFNQPHVDSCSAAIESHAKSSGVDGDSALFGNLSASGDALWAYAQCPDVDECDLKIHDCHPQAICTNTHGSYNCQCQRGYNGDGRTTCTRTCYYNCVNGYCVGAPDYSCKCDLGWTGVDCATNCGCNNHSTCSRGVGECDQCQDWTTGEFCQYCRTGSYGNATNGQGCHGCHCNEHGSKALGVCNFQTGECFCQDNTQGWNCETCQKGYYGDPRNGGMCYYQCMARGMMTGLEQQGLGSRLVQTSAMESRVAGASPSECLWIISPFHTDNHSEATREGTIQLTIHSDINVPCQENSLYVYDGQIDLSTNVAIHQSHVLGIFCSQDTTYPVTVEAISGIMTVHYKQGDISEGFNASYVVLSCPDHCPENRTCVNGQCACPEGWSGPNCASALCPRNCSADLKRGSCDKSYGRCLCAAGWGGLDCSEPINPSQLVFSELFNSEHISEAGTLSHWRKMLPRLGHTLSADRRGDLWMFGGYSLSHGALNDIRLFDTKNNTWMQITVDSTSDAKMPRGRYFHAAEIVQTRREIYIFGGMVVPEGEHNAYMNSSLSDTWKFALKSQRWIQIETDVKPPPLSGHTLTLRRTGESESLLLIGGFSPRFGYLSVVWEFDLERETWSILNTSGNQPLGVYGHSTVYHAPTQSLFVFGGYMYAINRTFISNKLYALHYPTRTWSVVPPFNTYNPAELNLPRARFLHTAITTDDYMLVFGGRTHPLDTSDSMMAYTYSCNQWVRLVSRDVGLVGSLPPPTYAHAMTVDPESDAVYVIGGYDGGIQSRVTRITVPKDLCSLWPQRERCRLPGCSYCAVFHSNGNNSSYCFKYNAGAIPDECSNANGTVISNNGIVCNDAWMSGACGQYSTCSECLARWPSNFDSQSCKWCSNLPRGHCVDKGASCGPKEREVMDVSQCMERQCPASDCEQCGALGNCVWTRQVQYTAELGVTVNSESVFDWNCVGDSVVDRSSIKLNISATCPQRCSEYKTCDDCLQSKGAEGGWHECRWSTQLRECISPSYQAMYCAGGVCGLVLRGGDTAHCPEPCSTYTKCSDCHLHSRCGWCALNTGNNTGRGVCTEGSPDGPARPCSEVFLQKSPRVLAALGLESMLMQGSDYNVTSDSNAVVPTFSFEFMKCPPENECENGHHTCDPISEQCVDEHDRFRCVCGPGYRAEKSTCVPVCSQGCVRGTCVEPNKCLCDFGYVGANCSIQCQCNGHSNCAGPDKLDQCLQCHNNTKGPQCERCKPLFVGDPTNNGQCVPCAEYCNGHTSICVNNSILNLPDLRGAELENYLVEGPTSQARCIGCANRTAGDKCEDCIEGNFRGSEDHRDPCRPCECHGHGHLCDAVTGERCNCQNNTESDPQCQSSLGKGPNQCWKMQCSKCRESFMGTPTGGHQCYKQMNVDLKFCLDAKLIEECKTKPRPLNPGQAVFFVVQPRFMNVDIRVIVDVTQGAIDLYLSPRDDTFIVNVHPLTGEHIIDMDQRYLWHPEEYEELPGGSRLSRVEVISPNSATGDNTTTERSSLRHSSNAQLFFRHEQNARGLTSFITVDQKNTFMVVRNLRDRLVLTLPMDVHDLGQTRFFLALVARNSSMGVDDPNAGQPSYGMIFFRQDQLHIDLFVFFSVFFSCFFLFIAVCVVGWKAKQAADIRRARRRHVVEMLHMAKRPFATLTLLMEPNLPERPPSSASSIQSQTVSPHRKKMRGGAGGHLGGGHLGSGAANRFSAGAGVRPVAVEPTDDGVAAVSTVFVRLPGGAEAPVRLAMASSLILLSRNHPIHSRTFLRRRSLNAPS